MRLTWGDLIRFTLLGPPQEVVTQQLWPRGWEIYFFARTLFLTLEQALMSQKGSSLNLSWSKNEQRKTKEDKAEKT